MPKFYAVEIKADAINELLFRELPHPEKSDDQHLEYQKFAYPDAIGVMSEFEVGRLFGLHYLLDPDLAALTIYNTEIDPVLKTLVYHGIDTYANETKGKLVRAPVTKGTTLTILYYSYFSGNGGVLTQNLN